MSGKEFFIGWQGKAPEKTGRFVKRMVIMAVVIALVLAAAIPALQRTVAEDARFDYGNVQEFNGILIKDPVPMLVSDKKVVYLLVHPFKHGFDARLAELLHLKRVTMKGSRIWRGEHEMIEVVPGSVSSTGSPDAAGHPLGEIDALGEATLVGEIVDSKCYLGVMNPGNLKPHRACAINCIRGGIPPVLLVRDPAGTATYVLLVREDGSSLNADILDLVAEPVWVRGQLKRLGEQLILYTNPARISLE